MWHRRYTRPASFFILTLAPAGRTRWGTDTQEGDAMGRLWRYVPGVAGPKYLVTRRDGTVPEWPWFVMGAADPVAPWALRLYAALAFLILRERQYAADVWRLAREFDWYRRDPANRKGDPAAPPHRADDPATVARMGG